MKFLITYILFTCILMSGFLLGFPNIDVVTHDLFFDIFWWIMLVSMVGFLTAIAINIKEKDDRDLNLGEWKEYEQVKKQIMAKIKPKEENKQYYDDNGKYLGKDTLTPLVYDENDRLTTLY